MIQQSIAGYNYLPIGGGEIDGEAVGGERNEEERRSNSGGRGVERGCKTFMEKWADATGEENLGMLS